MLIITIFMGLIALGLLIYLFYVLFRGEDL
ncbi:potassium-transporting ATPase subunit F [Listeria costaricensis]|nr:potassium-transporting ATPase subunit F [Listeria costaricensis]